MTPYQRGNRDGLLYAAAEMEGRAARETAEARRLEETSLKGAPVFVGGRASRAINHHFAAQAYTRVADNLRRMAEALPEDPEAPETP